MLKDFLIRLIKQQYNFLDMNKKIKISLAMVAVFALSELQAQTEEKNSGLHLTTGVGINKIQGSLGKTFRSTIAFNSGFEKSLGKNWFAQLEANFNTLKYDQQQKDINSEYLFQNTNSSLFMLTINGGRDFHFGESKWFASPYLGSGYINIGEPRIKVDDINNVITQSVVRRAGVLGKAGGRIGFNTRTKILQVIYIDGSYWTSSLKTAGSRVNSISVFIGMRMTM
jgi:hypothetical protein